MGLARATDQAYCDVLKNFSAKINVYAITLELTDSEITEIQADCEAFVYTMDTFNSIKKHVNNWASFKTNLRRSKKGNHISGFPVWSMQPAPPIVAPNISERFSKMIGRIKNHKNFNLAIGHDLGIIYSNEQLTSTEKNELKPILKIHLVAGQPIIEWKKGEADAIEIHKAEAASLDFKLIEIDLHPHFQDKSPLPATGQSIVWKYKAVYRINDERVGQWSDEVSISVMG